MRDVKILWLMICLAALPFGASAAGRFALTSGDFANHGTIPMAQVFNRDGCEGKNLSPALHWSDAPAGTKSFAITIYDPDARGGWWHWLVFNIPANVGSLPAGAGSEHSTSLPRGAIQGRNDFGLGYYGGPCPPPGDAPHHYRITVYALRVSKLPLGANTSDAALAPYLRADVLAKAELTGRYGRNK
ncbi:MAG: YbhB/YbcL family Raf kinase inhibitor-like protein [Gammaproteobacteria bacterium]